MQYACEKCGIRSHDKNGDYEGTTCKACGCGTLVRLVWSDTKYPFKGNCSFGNNAGQGCALAQGHEGDHASDADV